MIIFFLPWAHSLYRLDQKKPISCNDWKSVNQRNSSIATQTVDAIPFVFSLFCYIAPISLAWSFRFYSSSFPFNLSLVPFKKIPIGCWFDCIVAVQYPFQLTQNSLTSTLLLRRRRGRGRQLLVYKNLGVQEPNVGSGHIHARRDTTDGKAKRRDGREKVSLCHEIRTW